MIFGSITPIKYFCNNAPPKTFPVGEPPGDGLAEIERLLQQCRTSLAQERASQAAVCYKQVLEIDKDNVLAKNGLQAIEFYNNVAAVLAINHPTLAEMERAKQHLANWHRLNAGSVIQSRLERQWTLKLTTQYQQKINRAISAAQFVQAEQYLDELGRLHPESPVLSELKQNVLVARQKSKDELQGVAVLKRYQALIENALDNNQLNKANSHLEQMRRTDPTFPALAGLEMRLENKYRQFVSRAIGDKQYCKAHQYLDELRRFNPNSRFLPNLEKQSKKAFRDRLADGSEGPKMVWIPAGQFLMGGPIEANEQPVHSVSVNCFAMSLYEVSFAEYDRFADATARQKPDDNGWGRGQRPVIHVDWKDATVYADWLSQQTGQKYRLPTEAEWEYAARARTTTRYWWGDEIGRNRANCNDCGNRRPSGTKPVGSFAANPFGLFDTVGNVYELTCSEYQPEYTGKELRCLDKNNTDLSQNIVIRGGAWNDPGWYGRATYRNWYGQDLPYYNNVGFRLVRQ